ncbi:alpha/beta fold hydrolase [Rhizobium sp. WYJ-E13]|uniref:alpha/beta fold hydrolase n=1 Tax=unclassified Rhizobium TaxID=2613769 RepID=UPI001C1EE39B|nr:alpha/beta hydrolase [Rhizobium sp. WYJ-E13]QWW69519.1 alpha/beta hydrolase [Rhizobium sp. WYJ-E13]
MQPITRRSFSAALVAGAALSMFPAAGRAATVVKAKNVVLVHGAYADASCWLDVIPHLQAAGLNVMAVQNPLTSFADDVEATKRILALMDGPTVLAGHSYSGMLVTEAGVDPKVTALVYIAARAPDAGEDYTALAKQYPTPPASAGLVHAAGYAQLSEEAFVRDFAGDLPVARAKALYAVQGRISDTLFTAKTTVAAWRSKPSWYAVSKNDRTINPDLERFMAKRMNATTIELDASHVSLISQPRAVADLILAAAGSSEHS